MRDNLYSRAVRAIRGNKRISRLAREGGWIVIGQIATVLGALVLVRVLTEYLDPVQYGQLALALTVAALMNQVVMGGVAAGIGRFYSISAEKHDVFGYLRASSWMMLLATLAVAVIGFALEAGLVWLGYSQWMGLAAAALMLSVLSGYNSALNAIQNAARHRVIVAFHSGLDAWLKILLALGVMIWLGVHSTAVVIGFALSSLFVTASQYFFLRSIVRDRAKQVGDNQQWMRQMWLFSWPLVAGGLFNWGYYASQRWALELFATTSDVGQFYALTQIAYTPISMAGTMLLSFLMPILFAKAGDATDRDRLRNTHRIVMHVAVIGLSISLVIAIISFFAHDLIFRLMVAPKYRSISVYMPYVVLAAGILQVSHTLGSMMLTNKRTSSVLPLAIIGQLYIAGQNFVFVYFFEITGLVVSMIIGSIIHLVWMAIIVMRSNENNLFRYFEK